VERPLSGTARSEISLEQGNQPDGPFGCFSNARPLERVAATFHFYAVASGFYAVASGAYHNHSCALYSPGTAYSEREISEFVP